MYLSCVLGRPPAFGLLPSLSEDRLFPSCPTLLSCSAPARTSAKGRLPRLGRAQRTHTPHIPCDERRCVCDASGSRAVPGNGVPDPVCRHARLSTTTLLLLLCTSLFIYSIFIPEAVISRGDVLSLFEMHALIVQFDLLLAYFYCLFGCSAGARRCCCHGLLPPPLWLLLCDGPMVVIRGAA